MKKIIISEQQYKLITEKLGVPDNIYEISKTIYDGIIEFLAKYPKEIIDEKQIFFVRQNLNIGNANFDKIKIILFAKQHQKANKIEIYSWTMGGLSNIIKQNNKFAIKNKKQDPEMEIHMVSPSNQISFEEIKYGMTINKEENISHIAHELMHFYENQNKEYESVAGLAKYNANKGINTGIKEVQNMLFYIYYIDKIENITRPAELLALLKAKNTTKQNFLENLKNSEIYQKLIEMKNFKFENVIEGIKQEIKNQHNVEPDDYRVNMAIYSLYKIIKDRTAEDIFDIIASPWEKFLGTAADPDLRKFHDKNKFHKLQNQEAYKNYFYKLQTKINITANNMIKKIAKIYDLMPDENISEQASIHSFENWNLMHEINKTPIIELFQKKENDMLSIKNENKSKKYVKLSKK